jgi:N-acetylneuraminic acid mutarotase
MMIVLANSLPQPIAYATVVPSGHSFLLFGGNTKENSELSTIYSYDPEEDIWTLLDAKLEEGKRRVIAMEVDVEMVGNTEEDHSQGSEPKEKRRKC